VKSGYSQFFPHYPHKNEDKPKIRPKKASTLRTLMKQSFQQLFHIIHIKIYQMTSDFSWFEFCLTALLSYPHAKAPNSSYSQFFPHYPHTDEASGTNIHQLKYPRIL
jgi:hypothetical protein